MGIFSRFKDDLAKMRQQLTQKEILQEQEAMAKAEITKLRINRHHAREEMNRAQEQIKKHTAILEQANPNDPAFQAAKEGIELCVEKQTKAIQEIEEATRDIEKMKHIKSESHAHVKAVNKEAIINMFDATKENLGITKEELTDTIVSVPETVLSRAEFTADLATAKLHDFNDAMDQAIFEAKDHGLSAFAKLTDKIPAIDRAYRKLKIKRLEKDFARNEKIEQALDKLEKVTDLKVAQAKEAGHALKNLFANWKTEPKQQQAEPQQSQGKESRIDEFDKEMKEKKPGFLRRIINVDQKDLAAELEGLYKEQIQSYQKTIEHIQDRADNAIDKGYTTLEQSLNEMNMQHTLQTQELAAKALNMANEQIKRTQDELTR